MKIDTITRINNHIESLIKSRNINQLEAYIASINFSISLNLSVSVGFTTSLYANDFSHFQSIKAVIIDMHG